MRAAIARRGPCRRCRNLRKLSAPQPFQPEKLEELCGACYRREFAKTIERHAGAAAKVLTCQRGCRLCDERCVLPARHRKPRGISRETLHGCWQHDPRPLGE